MLRLLSLIAVLVGTLSVSAAEPLAQATQSFNQAKTQPSQFADAAKFFGMAFNSRVEMSQDQLAAWAYCRVKVAADKWNKSQGDAKTKTETIAEIEEALKLAPNYAELQKAGQTIVATIGGKPAKPFIGIKPTAPAPIPETGWFSLENESFIVRFQGSHDVAEAVAKKASESRAATFVKWSGPASGTWTPKCEIVLHPTAAAFAKGTAQPAAATGHAIVKFDDGQVTTRRIDLRLDDDTHLEEALPRELAHIVLADLFPTRAPPLWASLGMAVLSASGAEAERCIQTIPRCHKAGELFAITALLDMNGPQKPEHVTAYYVESVSIVDWLVRKKGEKAFTMFVRDSQRYGMDKALERQYGYNSAKQLDEEWRRAALATTRSQGP